jgi:hypothetical protein
VVAAPAPAAAAEGDTIAVEQDAARILQEMAEIRADMIAGVSRRPLFLMAKKCGVSRGLFVASKWDLLDGILEAEGLSPDRQDSSPSAQRRLRQLAAEAYRREAEETERRNAIEVYRREAEETERRDFMEQSPKPTKPKAHLPWRRFKSASLGTGYRPPKQRCALVVDVEEQAVLASTRRHVAQTFTSVLPFDDHTCSAAG